jgi:hypothetical protein
MPRDGLDSDYSAFINSLPSFRRVTAPLIKSFRKTRGKLPFGSLDLHAHRRIDATTSLYELYNPVLEADSRLSWPT